MRGCCKNPGAETLLLLLKKEDIPLLKESEEWEEVLGKWLKADSLEEFRNLTGI